MTTELPVATVIAREHIKALGPRATEADVSALISAIEQLVANSNWAHHDCGHGVAEGLSDAQAHLEHHAEMAELEEACP